MDLNKDRFISEEEFKKAQEAEAAKIRAIVQTMMPAQPGAAPPGPASAAWWPAGPGAATLRSAARPAPGHALSASKSKAAGPQGPRLFRARPTALPRRYSTVTLLARLRGWSTSVPLATAMW